MTVFVAEAPEFPTPDASGRGADAVWVRPTNAPQPPCGGLGERGPARPADCAPLSAPKRWR
eukprot:982962-Alexandrium_andersonii.AAC.1